MSTKLFGSIKAGSASVSLSPILTNVSGGAPDTGRVAANLTAYYYRQGGSATVSVSLSDLATLATAWSAGGVKEIGDGIYRVDWPDAAFAAGADWVILVIKDGTAAYWRERFAIEAHGSDDVYGIVSTWTPVGGAVNANVTQYNGVTPPVFPNNFSTLSINGSGAVTAGTVSDKTGYSLSATGLDSISVSDPGTPANWTTFPKILVALYRRFLKPTKLDNNTGFLTLYKDDGVTSNATQSISDNGTVQSIGGAS